MVKIRFFDLETQFVLFCFGFEGGMGVLLCDLSFFFTLMFHIRLTDRPDMTMDVYRGRKTTTQLQQIDIS